MNSVDALAGQTNIGRVRVVIFRFSTQWNTMDRFLRLQPE